MKLSKATTLFISLHAGYALAGSPAISLTVGEGFTNPIGFHDATPTFSWKLPDGVKKQTAYRVEVRDHELLWDSGWIESDQSVLVPYAGKPLSSRQSLSWRVDYRDEDGQPSGWSEPASFELGLLSSKDWTAKWIRPGADLPELESTSLLRRSFPITQEVTQARLHVTARGLFEIHLNGEKVGRDEFAQGWTSYQKRIDTLSYDVTSSLKKGRNAIGAMLGTGWYAGKIGFRGESNRYGSQPELLLQLEVQYADGSSSTLISDEDWSSTFDGPIRSSSIYNGENYDANLEIDGWSTAEFNDGSWAKVKANPDLGSAVLSPKPFAPVRVIEEIATQKLTEPEPGRFIFDLGQNMVGYPEIRIPVTKGRTITMRFAEMLNPDGTMYTDNYRAAKSTNQYTAARDGTITWKPTFTFHGFRYVELSGFEKDISPQKDWVTGLVLHSDLPRIGKFESSHPKLNQLQSNILWGQRGNFLDIPTDCPQRDERMGWTGDAQAFCSTSMFNYGSHAFWKSWLGSMRDDQLPSGKIPCVIPDVFAGPDSPGWMDAATIIPWNVYVRTGDKEILSENYQMMEGLVGFYRKKAKNHRIHKISAFGDWLQPYAKDNKGNTPFELLGTAFYAYSTQILADSAKVLGKTADAEKYQTEAKAVKQAFATHYFDEQGKLKNAPETQTAYILAFEFNIIPEKFMKGAEKNLLRLINEADGHLRTGFLGTPYIAQVLEETGNPEVAFDLLFKESYPSWFYSINQGATTMWERWDSFTLKDGFHPEGMNSFNHYAYGAIGQWMYERVAGLAPDPTQPGYKHFFVRPLPGGPLTSASATLETAYGTASSSWALTGRTLEMNVRVPPNTSATIEFPNGREKENVGPGIHRYRLPM
ncbi:family 78 glycoside hydrolase catalytic domain [Haloferula chungangensis]|uniref:alpha-L-rhamnosidase n=1 Tax=Haloferula chungangensis TaxID=1048331 RepID=A0ABW2L2N5_9BACT